MAEEEDILRQISPKELALAEEIVALTRDFTRIPPMAKSEVRKKLHKLVRLSVVAWHEFQEREGKEKDFGEIVSKINHEAHP